MIRRVFNRSDAHAVHPGARVRARDGAAYTVAMIAHGQVWAYTSEGLRPIAVAWEDECEQGAPGLLARPHSPGATHIAPQGLDTRLAA